MSMKLHHISIDRYLWRERHIVRSKAYGIGPAYDEVLRSLDLYQHAYEKEVNKGYVYLNTACGSTPSTTKRARVELTFIDKIIVKNTFSKINPTTILVPPWRQPEI